MTEKEKWVDEVLKSLDGVSKIQPPDTVYQRIQQKFQKVVSIPIILGIAASFLLLVFLNINIINSTYNVDDKPNSSLKEELGIFNSNQLY